MPPLRSSTMTTPWEAVAVAVAVGEDVELEVAERAAAEEPVAEGDPIAVAAALAGS